MPRVSAAHEQAVRRRIIDGAVRTFGRLGYERATMQDVVRETDLSIGAIYTHFRSKSDVFLAACVEGMETEQEELTARLSAVRDPRERIQAGIEHALSFLAEPNSEFRNVLVDAWLHADDSPELRELLLAREAKLSAMTRLIVEQAVANGELAPWIDTEALTGFFLAFMDGVVIQAERRMTSIAAARRQAYAMLDIILAAPHERPGQSLPSDR
jgi:AcrR family transcriptional regulator